MNRRRRDGARVIAEPDRERLGTLTLDVHAEVPTDELHRMMCAYPTSHHGVEDALRDLGS